MDSKAISRRLDALQKIADRGKPCKVVVTFTDGSSTTTTAFTPDRPEYDGLCGALSVLCHPVPDRRIEDFE